MATVKASGQLAAVVGRRSVERLRQSCSSLIGWSPCIAIIHSDHFPEAYKNQLFAWFFETVPLNEWLDTQIDEKPAMLWHGFYSSNRTKEIVKACGTIPRPAYDASGVTKLRIRVPEQTLIEINRWMLEFRDVFRPLANHLNLKIPPVTQKSYVNWWLYFRNHLPLFVPSFPVVRAYFVCLPVGEGNDVFQAVMDGTGPVADAGRLIFPGDLCVESEIMLDAILDWIDTGCILPETEQVPVLFGILLPRPKGFRPIRLNENPECKPWIEWERTIFQFVDGGNNGMQACWDKHKTKLTEIAGVDGRTEFDKIHKREKEKFDRQKKILAGKIQ